MRRSGLRAALWWVRIHVGRRGGFLSFLALLDAVLASSLIEPLPYGLSERQVYGLFLAVAPIRVWAIAWALVGLVCLIGVLWKPARSIAFALAALLKYSWAAVYVWAWLSGSMPQGYRSAVVWGTFAAVVLLVGSWPDYIKPDPDDGPPAPVPTITGAAGTPPDPPTEDEDEIPGPGGGW